MTKFEEEFDRALKDLSRNEAPGVDDILSELLKSLGEPAMRKLLHLVCKMYETGEVPSEFKKNVIIPIPKKAGAVRCENYRTISLISHGCKILTRIIYRSMEKLVEAEGKVIYNLYKNQTAVVRVEGHERDAVVGKGVRQGCSLSLMLFNLYIEH